MHFVPNDNPRSRYTNLRVLFIMCPWVNIKIERKHKTYLAVGSMGVRNYTNFYVTSNHCVFVSGESQTIGDINLRKTFMTNVRLDASTVIRTLHGYYKICTYGISSRVHEGNTRAAVPRNLANRTEIIFCSTDKIIMWQYVNTRI